MDKNKFNKASNDCKKVTEWLKVPIQFEFDTAIKPIFTDNLVHFNGVDEEGHETFLIQQTFEGYRQEIDGKLFQFCKTARKPYDTAVTACLIIFKHHFGNDFVVKSDGYPSEWQNGLNAVKECLGYGENPMQAGKLP